MTRTTHLLSPSGAPLGYDFQERHHLRLFGNARVARIEDAGHRVMVERPDTLLELLRGELSAFGEGGLELARRP